MNKFANLAACFLLFLSSFAALAENSKKVPELHAGTKIDDPEVDALVVSLLNTYLLLRKRVSIGRAIEGETTEMNFYFASGPEFIIDQRLSPRALTAFNADAINELGNLPSNSDTCYVQSIVLSAGSQHVVLAIHDEDNDDPEDVFRCLIAGLWKFQVRDLSKLNVLDWRRSFFLLSGEGSD